jgi:hypothetical protein
VQDLRFSQGVSRLIGFEVSVSLEWIFIALPLALLIAHPAL